MSLHPFAAYWSATLVQANLYILLHLLGALALGLLVGYERTYHGRAAGMRTYGLLCMSTAALTVIGGFSHFWYGGSEFSGFSNADVSRVVQGVLTGIGFLCAGVIMKDGFTITGLTTATSLWTVAVTGMLVGLGMYMAGIALALLCTLCMAWMSRLEARLPVRPAVAVRLLHAPGTAPHEAALQQALSVHGYAMAPTTLVITLRDEKLEWSFVAVSRRRFGMEPLRGLADALQALPCVQELQVALARN